MHELGIVFEVVKTVKNFADDNGLTKIDTVVLQIGELSSIVPHYIEECYPAAVDGTSMQNTKLKIEILPGNARCNDCHNIYNVIMNNGKCPKCGSQNLDILGGREFMIKEIIAC